MANDKTLEDLVEEYVAACRAKAEFLHEHARPPGQRHKYATPEVGSHWKELDDREKKARKKMDEAFLNAIPPQWRH